MAEHDGFSCAPVLVINLRTVFHCDCIHLSSSLGMCEGARRARGLGFERQSRSWNAHKHYRSCATEDNGASREFCGPRDHFLRIGDVGRRDLVHHFGGRVAQHPLGPDVEDLDDALRVRRDAREVGAVEDRALQSARLQQRLLAPKYHGAVRTTLLFTSVIAKSSFWHKLLCSNNHTSGGCAEKNGPRRHYRAGSPIDTPISTETGP